MDLIEAVLASTKDFEAPRRFYYWSTIAAISAVLKDKVWFDMAGNYTLHPNIYVLLYGPSGVRKGPAVALAQKLVEKTGVTRVIDGRSSIEAVIKELGTIRSEQGKPPINDNCGFMVASELSSSIIGNNSAMDIMTNLYDRLYNEGDWNYRLKVGESTKLKKPTITWLAATNEALFKDFVPEKNLNGGLIGRTFVITESKRARLNSLMFKTVSPDINLLSCELKKVGQLQGEFKTTDEVRYAFDEWYNKFGEESESLNDDTGFVSRVGDYIIKIAMILSAGRRQDKQILIEDIAEAIKVVRPLVVPTRRVVNSVKKKDDSIVTKRGYLLTYLANRPEFKDTRERLLRNLGLQIDHEDLDKMAQHLVAANVLTIDSHGGTVTYRLRTDRPEINEWIEEYKK